MDEPQSCSGDDGFDSKLRVRTTLLDNIYASHLMLCLRFSKQSWVYLLFEVRIKVDSTLLPPSPLSNHTSLFHTYSVLALPNWNTEGCPNWGFAALPNGKTGPIPSLVVLEAFFEPSCLIFRRLANIWRKNLVSICIASSIVWLVALCISPIVQDHGWHTWWSYK